MTELTKSGNEISKLMLQALAPTLPGAHIGKHYGHLAVYELLSLKYRFRSIIRLSCPLHRYVRQSCEV